MFTLLPSSLSGERVCQTRILNVILASGEVSVDEPSSSKRRAAPHGTHLTRERYAFQFKYTNLPGDSAVATKESFQNQCEAVI